MPAGTEYNLEKGSYTSFDAITLKQFIKDRLTTDSNFTDQNYEGSNLAAITDVFAFAYHILLFYYNQTASDSLFGQAELYENMNKIVRAIGYKPSGPQTSILPFKVNASADLDIGAYNIKRYSFFDINGILYSFTNDISFDKTLSAVEQLEAFQDSNLLFQGKFKENPVYTAIGENYELITMAVDNINDNLNESFIDHNSVDVYVKDIATGTWFEWAEVDTVYLETPSAKVYERRLNENGRYELRFGNDINGKKLVEGDQVAIFYLESDGPKGKIGAGILDNTNLLYYNSINFSNIAADIYDSDLTFLSINDTDKLTFSNEEQSTEPTEYESVGEIRDNAPKLFSAQKRVVTAKDYVAHIAKNYSNIIETSSVASNDKYTSEYLGYFYDIGLDRPNDDTNILTNQVTFADACDFNNIYIFAVPKTGAVLNETDPNVLSTAQKQLIVNELEDIKMVTAEVLPSDPVYMAFDVGLQQAGEEVNIDNVRDNCLIHVTRETNSKLSTDQIKNIVYNKFVDFFDQTNNELGQLISTSILTNNLLAIDGVSDISTLRVLDGETLTVPGVSFIVWNPLYPLEDVNITGQNIKLPFFKFPFLYEKTKFLEKIVIDTIT